MARSEFEALHSALGEVSTEMGRRGAPPVLRTSLAAAEALTPYLRKSPRKPWKADLGGPTSTRVPLAARVWKSDGDGRAVRSDVSQRRKGLWACVRWRWRFTLLTICAVMTTLGNGIVATCDGIL
jgi:hypothetical protein